MQAKADVVDDDEQRARRMQRSDVAEDGGIGAVAAQSPRGTAREPRKVPGRDRDRRNGVVDERARRLVGDQCANAVVGAPGQVERVGEQCVETGVSRVTGVWLSHHVAVDAHPHPRIASR